jgi:uncharacterized protein YbaR (Trm112 family)
MGMFDSLIVACPKCHKELEFQSKSGSCGLDVYNADNLPPEVAIGMNGDIIKCQHCKTNFRLECNFPKKVKIKLIKTMKENDY